MGTVSKALELLDLFTRARPLIGLSELARLSDVNKATCHRLMTELQNHGLVEQVGSAREYRLGPAVLRLASLREAHVPMRDAAQPILQSLANATGETAHLAILIGSELRSLAFAYSAAYGTKVIMEDVEVLPFHATSSGMAALAHLGPERQAAVLQAPLARHTGDTETDPERLRAQLARIAAGGISESDGGFEAEVHSFAVPLFDSAACCIGTLAVACPRSRVSPELRKLVRRELIQAAQQITQIWGGNLPPDLAQKWHAQVA